MFVLFGHFADVARSLSFSSRCLTMFPGRVTVFPDATPLFADVITISADLTIGHHRDPLSGRCKQGLRYMTYWYTRMLMLTKIFGVHDEGHTASIQLYMMQWSLDNALRISIGLQIEWIPPPHSLNNIPKYTREHYINYIIDTTTIVSYMKGCAAIILCGSSHSTVHCNVKYIQ